MTEQFTAPPPLPTGAKAKSRWKWLKILIGITAAGFLVIGIVGSYHSPDLDLELVRRDLFDAAHDGKVLEITNVGTKPIKLTGLTVNDRPDCKVYRLDAMLGNNTPLFPSILKVGDEISIAGSCQVVKATVETDQGSSSYSFRR